MSRSDSKIDLDKYKPSVEDARRLADEEAAQERLKKALDNPALDAALAEARGAAPKARARVSKPSPWAKGATPGAETIDKAALPSATAPAVLPERPPVNAKEERRWWRKLLWSHLLVGLVLALVPAILVFVLLVRPQQPDGQHDAAAATSAATPMPPASASSGSAAPATTASSAQAPETPAPATSAAPTSVPSAAVPAPERPHGSLKPPTGSDDPYGDAAVPPSPKATAVEPVQAPTADPHPPSAVKPSEPVPQPSASSSAGFQYFRKHD